MIRFRFILLMVAVVAVFLTGTVGYAYMLGLPLLDSFYFTVVTISTVGYGEIYPTTPESRLFTTILIIIGIGVLAVALETITEELARRSVAEVLGVKEPKRKQLENHYIICGYGRVGQIVARELERLGEKYVVIERSPQLAKSLSEKGIPVIEGSALEEEVLRRAGIEKAKGLITVLGKDSDNVFITITAKTLNPNLYVVARVSDENVIDKVYKVGADRVISPELEGGKMLARALTHPHIVEMIESLTLARDIEVAYFHVGEEYAMAGKKLVEAELEKKSGAKIMAICRQGNVEVRPRPETVIDKGCVVLAIGNRDQIRRLEKLLTEKREEG
ncbi:hypothetical protein DRO53_01280 [Candidatus Bathyarchaeota archaeon]|nr:MAG: hypothetical protein DRO46_04160 [Candidatus Hecatellales archaeon]RLI35435.1 MAG: hypothetical protein DRO53_01280 [Candidatus Bathyarchaeota archaeon]